MRQQKPPRRQHNPSPNEAICTITRMLVAAGRQMGNTDDAIRTTVKDAIKEALDGDKTWKRAMEIEGEPAPVEMVNSAGLYRLVFNGLDLDRSNLYAQERWHQIVMQELEATLKRHDGDFRRRGAVSPGNSPWPRKGRGRRPPS